VHTHGGRIRLSAENRRSERKSQRLGRNRGLFLETYSIARSTPIGGGSRFGRVLMAGLFSQ
jgi:hypothetical protein